MKIVEFYDIFTKLCAEFDVKPCPMLESIGIKKSAASNWKSRKTKPTNTNLQKIADYFGVTVEYLKGDTEPKKPLVNNDEELTDYLQELKDREEMRMLFSVTKTCTKEEVEQAVRIIEALRKEK